ncbi:Peptidyl-prolyl cis-trans isomerase CYP7 [Candida viswanathii]|uniref:peptidylprolyl isomerase n=1 Tax=Candida viswanathii TaxID=5486 RepID=A0A367Y014_9ASCO|nr:Peptidyl-prolyl cis-trans isomerase CYP7 [Candida viswanathii]
MKIESVRPRAYLDINIEDKLIGRLVFELYEDLAPKATENFLNLCQGITLGDEHYSYKSTSIDLVIKNFMISGGSINGANVSTIYGEDGTSKPIPGENLSGDLGHGFKLCTANDGDVNNNGSQFFITIGSQPHMVGSQSVFGELIHGKSVAREIERVKTDQYDRPQPPVTITDCGKWVDGMAIPITNACYDKIGGDIYEEYPEDDSNFNQDSTESAFEVASTIKESGTLLFKQGKKQEAKLKYVKCLRYIMEFIPDQDQDHEWYTKFLDLKKKTYLNLSLVCLQLKDLQKCVDYCSYLLAMGAILTTQDKTKAHYRKGTACIGLKKYEEALDDLEIAEKLSPDDPVVSKSLETAKDLVQKQKQKDKAKYAKFFG